MRARLRLSYVGVAAALLLALAVPLLLVESSAGHAGLAADARRSAETKALLSAPALVEGDDAWLETIVAAQLVRSGGAVAIRDRSGRLRAATPDRGGWSPLPDGDREVAAALAGEGQPDVAIRRPGWVTVVAPVDSDGEVIGAVEVGIPTSAVEARLRRLQWALGGFAAITLAAVWLLGGRLASWVTAPLSRVRDATVAWADGDLERRAEVSSGPPELRELGAAFDDMADRLERLLAAQRSFVADVSHELRLPLTTFRMCLANLEPDLAPASRRELRKLDSELAGFARRLDDLLLLATCEVDSDVLQVVDAVEAVESRVQLWQPLARSRQVALAVDLPRPDVETWVWELPGGLGQILDNLLSNAVKVTPPGATVTLRVLARDAGIEVHVVDEGVGMSAEERGHAFERSWRAGPRGGDGAGLGLAIVRRVAGAMDATVELDEGPTGGIDAVVTLSGLGAQGVAGERPGATRRRSTSAL